MAAAAPIVRAGTESHACGVIRLGLDGAKFKVGIRIGLVGVIRLVWGHYVACGWG